MSTRPHFAGSSYATYVRVYWDDQDPANKGWAYRQYDGDPRDGYDSATLVESGALDETDPDVAPAADSVVSQVGLPIDPSHVIYE